MPFASLRWIKRSEITKVISMLRSAVERQMMIIGEALDQAVDLQPELSEQISEVREIVNLRNVIVHGYAVVENETIWGIVTDASLLLSKHKSANLFSRRGEFDLGRYFFAAAGAGALCLLLAFLVLRSPYQERATGPPLPVFLLMSGGVLLQPAYLCLIPLRSSISDTESEGICLHRASTWLVQYRGLIVCRLLFRVGRNTPVSRHSCVAGRQVGKPF